MSATETVVEVLPDCDFCGNGTKAVVDGRTSMGPWANMCQIHHDKHGVGLGTGKGQKLKLREPETTPRSGEKVDSPKAAEELRNASEAAGGWSIEVDELMGQTDCPEGCEVEPDGWCPHGYLSAGRSAGVV
jgi:hypothetical protein